MNKICVYAICKNESAHIDRWVESMNEADCIVVLDTGSTDDSVEKLRSYGIRVEQKSYEFFRFDTARNDALALVPSDCNILVSTDIDEYFEPGWADVIKSSWIEGVHKRASFLFYYDSNNKKGFYYDKVHTREFFWKYPVHEFLVRKNSKYYLQEECLFLENSVVLHHEQDSHSRAFYLDLLKLRAEENDGSDSMGTLYLAREYSYNNDWEECLSTAIKALDRYAFTAEESAFLHLLAGDSLYYTDRIFEAEKHYTDARVLCPSSREPWQRLGMLYLNKKYNMPEIAKAFLVQGIKESYRKYSWLEDETLWTWRYYDWLAVACYYTGAYSEGLKFEKKALDEGGNIQNVLNNIKLLMEKLYNESN